MKNLLNNVVYNSVFNFSLNVKKKEINKIPDECFGAFISVVRSKSQSLKTWPNDIHGCIGEWDNNFKKKKKDAIFNIMIEVGNSACNKDSRKNNFKPIFFDSQAEFKVYFMMLPILNIDLNGKMNNGKFFNNNDYGIIVDNGQSKATFLPKVFKDTSWNDLKQKLITKAGINNKNITFYAYKAQIHSVKIFNVIKYIREHIFKNFLDFNLQNYKDFIPYEINNHNVSIDKSQYVRNVATINDILKLQKYKNINQLLPIINKNLEYYINIFNKNNKQMRQASSFLILALQNSDVNKTTFIKNTCSYLVNNIDDMDKSFELGEVSIALNEVCMVRTKLLKIQKKMFKDLLVLSHTNDSIFRYNWEAKFLYSLVNPIKTSLNNPIIKKHAILIVELILKNVNLNEHSETNYLAVTFEALSSLLFIKNKKLCNEIKDKLFYIFYLLQQRYNENGLYYFKDNTNARLDITGHIINGLLTY